MTEKNVSNFKNVYRTVNKGDFPEEFSLELKKEFDLRYGENPNQPGAIYSLSGTSIAELTGIKLLKSGKGGLSATNTMDVTRALDILKFFDEPSVAVMKHLIPSGFATKYEGNTLTDIYRNARDADARSAFGSIVVFNTKVDEETAKEILTSYVEGVAAPDFDEKAVELFETKKNIRIITFSNLDKLPKFDGDNTEGIFDIKMMPAGRLLVQKPYLSKIKSKEDLVINPLIEKEEKNISVKRNPSEQEIKDLLTSWYINLGVRSNGIVIVKNGVTLAVGSGQQERVGAVEQAVLKAYQKAMDREKVYYESMEAMSYINNLKTNPLKGAVISSDGFFPFRDSVDFLSKYGIKAVIQPGGSIKDFEIIEAVNEHDMSMVYTMERCFGHF